MARNNIKLLDSYQLKSIKQRYSFSYDESSNTISVNIVGYDRQTIHSALYPFSLNTKVRRITITVEMIDIWKKLQFEPHLIDVQQAVNLLYVMYQPISVENVTKILQKNRIKIKTV